MVILAPIIKRKLQEEAHQQGRQQGRHETNIEWEAWLKRRDEAHANDRPFDEPPPSKS